MTRKRLVEIANEQRNEFARSQHFRQLLGRCFSPDILPPRPGRFTDREIFPSLYISTRTKGDGSEEREERPFAHEEYLDDLFWNGAHEDRKIYVLGDVGCGKSTLIDYYLRCYCPSRGTRTAEFDKKLILHFDALGTQDATQYSHNFFLLAQSIIRSRCVERHFDIDGAVRHSPNKHRNIREWVWVALEELSRGQAPFQYIVLVIDNLDQCPVEVQSRAIRDVKTWLDAPSIRLWRVIIPLWPSTLTRLRNRGFDPLGNIRSFRIGSVPASNLITARLTAIQQELAKPTTNAMPAQAGQYISELHEIANERLLQRITMLSNGDLRRKLSMWEAFLSGEVAYSIWRQQQTATTRRSYDYELLDGLLRGMHDVFQSEQMRIANIFEMGKASKTSRDLLLGLHALTLLDHGVCTRSTFAGNLLRLGYDEDAISAVEQKLMLFNVYHETPAIQAGGLGVEYEVHGQVVQAYLTMCVEPAYLDNVALVTPVDPALHKRMRKTRGDHAEDFVHRVETTLAFIEFVRDNEDQFRRCSSLSRAEDADLFQRDLREMEIPCYWKRMALRYQERLTGLRDSSYLRFVPAAWWDDVVNRPLFAQGQAAAEYLTPLD